MHTFSIEFGLRYRVITRNRLQPSGVSYTPTKSKKYFIDIVSTNKVYHKNLWIMAKLGVVLVFHDQLEPFSYEHAKIVFSYAVTPIVASSAAGGSHVS